MSTHIKMLIQKAFKRAGYDLHRIHATSLLEIWIDVGAHLGESTLGAAIRNPSFLRSRSSPIGNSRARSWVRPQTSLSYRWLVSVTDGVARFFVNVEDGSSSLLGIKEDYLERWKGRIDLSVREEVLVPTIRLDTFLRRMNLRRVDYLKVDAEGTDRPGDSVCGRAT